MAFSSSLIKRFCAGVGDSVSSISPSIEGKETEVVKANESTEAEGLIFTLVLSLSLQSFCVGDGDPVSSLSPAAGGKEAEDMGPVASLSMKLRLVVE